MEINKQEAKIILAYLESHDPMRNNYVDITNEEYEQSLELRKQLKEFIEG